MFKKEVKLLLLFAFIDQLHLALHLRADGAPFAVSPVCSS